ncbi:hypothetical protein P2318_34585 [Myxococcaceae bacterium GXIMD 01537]
MSIAELLPPALSQNLDVAGGLVLLTALLAATARVLVGLAPAPVPVPVRRDNPRSRRR